MASEWVRAERKELQKQGQLSESCSKSSINQETAPRLSAGTQEDLEARIKSAFAKFLQNSVAAVLEAWDDAHRFGFYFLTFQKVCVWCVCSKVFDLKSKVPSFSSISIHSGKSLS